MMADRLGRTPMLPGLRAFGASTLISYAALVALSHVSGVPYLPRVTCFFLVLVVTTAAPGLLLLASYRAPSHIGPADVRAALLVAVACGVVCASASPITSRDFWYYLASGRLAASGANVYTQTLTDSAMAGLWVQGGEYPRITMPYGPAWVAISTVLSRLAGHRFLLEFAVYKALMLSSWIFTLNRVSSALRHSPVAQFRAVLMLGWLPLPLLQILVEGHNDIVMVALMTAWLVSANAANNLLLAGSVLVKYVTAPLLAVAAVDAVIRRSARSGIVLTLGVVAAAMVLLAYWQGGALLVELRFSEAYELFTPVALMSWSARTGKLPLGLVQVAIVGWRLVLVALIVWYGWRHVRTRSLASLWAWVTAVFLGILLGSHHVLPWYLIWILPSLLLAADTRLLTVAWPFLLLMPFLDLVRVFGRGLRTHGRLTVMFFVGVAACWVAQYVYSARSRRNLR